MEKLSYALGMVIAHNLKGMGVSALDNAAFAQAVSDVMGGATTTMSDAEAQRTVSEFMQKQQAEAGKAVREAGEKFLAENAEKPGVVVLPSGLQYTVITEGTGAKPKATDRVKCHYEGTLTNGQVFDSSYRRGEPAVFPLNGVIAGWTEGVQLMAEGAKYRFFIPYHLAYGERGAGQSIPPYAALVFDVELIEIVK
ncbi:MAG: FKBP-type peptidyl-prolyl cis-trans isomerase [Bacteroidales bacterium]|nr:FKBP-type peptidyl-prolyl cis-trans isomerase [Bacteroidales bacterium]MCI7316015.1 FKBP-type peptidyl-prolyl cis-trans isomerase [Bacteroidales bacterium]MDD6922077.1 FKBP-type peptidyl-prolyl cis-trans isomerase [Bacteroidales bacterium]MEE0904139.1 FKBP-type peptidyl-prolyl cis-trans isomerase [Prevotellamassilia sp.]